MTLFIQTRTMIRALTLSTVLAASTAAFAATPSQSSRSYDGNWSVVIITEKGTCDRTRAGRTCGSPPRD